MTYLIGMKLQSAREQDLKDVADVVRAVNDEQPLDLLSRLEDIGFRPDVSVLLDAFATAHGLGWLEVYYEAHQAELGSYF